MIETIMKEKISADHLLYVSLKYTKTCDVILNLIKRWIIMINHCIDALLEQQKKRKKIKTIPIAPRQKAELVKQNFKNVPEIMKTLVIYDFFKRIDDTRAIKECEFRKDVRLKVVDNGQEIIINLDKLKEYSMTLESFISYIKQFLLSPK
ncbi:hypothetical protein FJZ17_04390 [Candidatus Pacearchaeota archaeon]|nr:hypothetical protein [Candidatus Pacearchaeota archaeon]